MTSTTERTEVIKFKASTAEKDEIRRKCAIAGRSVASVLRDLVHHWQPDHRNSLGYRPEGPKRGPNARQLPMGRRGGAMVPKRL